MQLSSIDRIETISPAEFQNEYLHKNKPLIIKNLSHDWPAYHKWNWDYLKNAVGGAKVAVYNNIRAGATVPVNGSDGEMLFSDYLDMVQKGPVELRIFLFNIFKCAPGLVKDLKFPFLLKGFLKRYPMLFAGGEGSVAHMHYDLDCSHIFHTQFMGRKKVLLFDNSQSTLLYKMPSTVESAASFVNWQNGVDTERFPALNYARGYEAVLEHGDTLFMPAGYWHHMEYMESGFAMSLRALPEGIVPKLNSLYHLVAKRGFNNALIRMAPSWWYSFKRRYAHEKANEALARMPQLVM